MHLIVSSHNLYKACKHDWTTLGFKEEGQVELFRTSLRQYMKPHADVNDEVGFVALIVSRAKAASESSGTGFSRRDGALGVAGAPLASKGVTKPCRSALDFVKAVEVSKQASMLHAQAFASFCRRPTLITCSLMCILPSSLTRSLAY